MDILYKSLVKLQKELPWVNDILRYTDIEVSNKVDIACISLSENNSRYKMLLNIEAIENNADILNIENDIIGVIEHEILHVLYNHLDLTWPKENFHLANITMDLVINETGKFTKGISLPKIDKNSIKEKYDIDFDKYYDTSEDIFRKLLEEKEKNDSNGKSDSNDSSGKSDSNDSNGNLDSFDSTNIKDLMQKEAEILEENTDVIPDDILQDIAENMSNGYGDIASNLKRSVKARKNNFKALFRKLIGNTLKQNFKRTFKKVGKRFPNQKGRVKLKKPSVLLVVDTSGSMSNEALEKINYQINILAQKFDLEVCFGDTELQGHEKIKCKTKFNGEFSGGGGTDLQFYKEIKGKFDLHIFNTDGYIPSNIWPKNSIFCIFSNGKKIEGYTNLNF